MSDSLAEDTLIFNNTMSKLERAGFLGKLDNVAFPNGQPIAASVKSSAHAEYRDTKTGKREFPACPYCKFSKRVGGDVWNCYVGGKLKMSKKDDSVPAKMCCMSWCHDFEWNSGGWNDYE